MTKTSLDAKPPLEAYTESHQTLADEMLAAIHHALSASGSQKDIAEVFMEAAYLALRKNSDYGDSVFQAPVLAPEITMGESIRIRMSDKIQRIISLEAKGGQGSVLDESLEDTYMDLGTYAFLKVIHMRAAKRVAS